MIAKLDSRLRLLEMKCRHPVEHLLAGEYHSVFRGQGIEFEDVRPYQPGDDVRRMDWRVTARTGEPYIKRFIEEREQVVYLLVDVSASVMGLPGGGKRGTMAELCSLITLSAVQNHDRVGLILFSDRIELVVPPGKGRHHALRIMDALVHYEPKGRKTSFAEVLGRFGHMARKRSIAFVVSDFLADDYLEEMESLAVRHDMNAVNLIDPQKFGGPDDGLVWVEDTESGETRCLDLRQQDLGDESHHERFQEQMLESGVNLMELETGEDCVAALAGFFRSRQRRLADESGG